MYFVNFTKQILREMWLHKLRSSMAIFCIAWGTLTVVLLLALGDGFQQASRANIMRIAENAFFVIPTSTTKSFEGYPKGQPINVKADDIENLAKKVPEIKYASPMFVGGDKISYKKKLFNVRMLAVNDQFVKIRSLDMQSKGRFLNPLDIKRAARVVVLGWQVKDELFGNKKALGKDIVLHGVAFKVIGVLKESYINIHANYATRVIIPYSSYISLFGDVKVNFFVALPNPKIDPDQAERSVRSYFAHIYHFNKTDKAGFKVFNTIKMFQFFNWFFIGIKIFLLICGALTLGVGALGVANMMFLIVTERTKEIGLRMAVGANYWHILVQIITEALVIVALGGLIGFGIAYSTIFILNFVPLPEWLGAPVLSTSSFVISIITLALLGLLAGFFPARRAALLDPITALTE